MIGDPVSAVVFENMSVGIASRETSAGTCPYRLAEMSRKVLTADNVRIVRPGFGLSPKYDERVLGKELKQAAQPGTPVSWELFDK